MIAIYIDTNLTRHFGIEWPLMLNICALLQMIVTLGPVGLISLMPHAIGRKQIYWTGIIYLNFIIPSANLDFMNQSISTV